MDDNDFGSISFLCVLSCRSCGSDFSGVVKNLYSVSCETENLSGIGGNTLAHCHDNGCSFVKLQFRLSAIALDKTSAKTLTFPGK